MTPFAGAGTGFAALGPDALIGTESGVAEHVGSYQLAFTLPYDGSPGNWELTADNGDKLQGHFVIPCLQIQTGTGRFMGAIGSLRSQPVFGEPTDKGFPYTTTLIGAITTVGSNEK
jgi:hypothetical protein